MGRMKELWQERQEENKALGGLYDVNDPLTTGLEMSFPCYRVTVHQAADSADIESLLDLVFHTTNKLVGEA